MPDAHVGYGLPIGGVLATSETVIPYAVGVDIACFAGETRVPLLDGRDYCLRELAERGGEFVVYACTPSGRVVAARATAHRTRDNAELVEVELDNGETIRCTPDHHFMRRDGSFCAASELESGASLMPLYKSRDREGYVLVQQNYSTYFQRAHWMVARSGILGEIPSFEGQRTVIHHRNFDQGDNRPENLEFMGDQDHLRLHRCSGGADVLFQSVVIRGLEEDISACVADELFAHRRLQHGTNHKVVAVRKLEAREEVFCLNVPDYENFALSAGVFVHNCRMRISIYDASPHILGQHKGKFEKSLSEQTKFGMKERFSPHDRPDHPVLDDQDWRATNFLKPLRQKAIEQLGTSGGGNHFVEWGEFELTAPSPELGLGIGKYLALLSHSGSRAVGFKIANEFSRLAMSLHPKLDQVVKHLAWLDLDSDAGRDYWLSMELAGRFAAANHAIIHARVSKAAGVKEVAHVENHHNFAWKETMADGSEAIVHRKGATPAGAGVLGVIPGSMADPGFVVRGLGKVESLNSASHGAGRKLGRKAAINSLTKLERDRYLQERGVKLLGGGLDEAPQAYKNIDDVIAAQTDLVEVIGKFTPRIVRMADEAGDY